MNIWQQAVEMAEATPKNRNRYVDFLRAVSILVVVVGHWLIAGFQYENGAVESIQVLAILPSTQPLTWIFQVMPIFFIVGGYSNAVSLLSAQRQQQSYGAWLSTRLDRLVRPLLPLIGLWAVIAMGLQICGIPVDQIQLLTQIALIPIWFLAIYVIAVLFAPLTFKAWQRFGIGSVAALMGMAVLVDFAVFELGASWAGWTNYLWVWLGVHQLGYGWPEGRFRPKGLRTVIICIGGWLSLAALVFVGPYPLAMVGSPDSEISNTLPPKITLLALAIAQFAMVLMLERPVNKWLANVKIWAATVLVNSMIMTLYLWHITAMLALVFAAWLVGGMGLTLVPGELDWWLTRPLWIAILFACLLPIALPLSPIERTARPENWRTNNCQLVFGAVLICAGIAVIATFGIGSTAALIQGYGAVTATFVGAAIAGVMGIGKRERG